MTVEDSDQACSSCLPSRPLAQTCVVCGRTPPRFFFFVLSGSACNGVQLAIDRVLALVLPPNTWWVPTFCWTVSYAASVSFRFVSHAAIVFGPHRDPPLLALGKTYCTYLSTIVASTAVNLALVAGLGLAHEVALVPTAAFSVCWSYIALSYTWRDSTGKSGSLLCCARDGNHRQTWYRAVDADHATPEEHTPMSQARLQDGRRGHLGGYPGLTGWRLKARGCPPRTPEERPGLGLSDPTERQRAWRAEPCHAHHRPAPLRVLVGFAAQRHASFASKLASAAWLAPGVLESAGLTPQQRERAISQASQVRARPRARTPARTPHAAAMRPPAPPGAPPVVRPARPRLRLYTMVHRRRWTCSEARAAPAAARRPVRRSGSAAARPSTASPSATR